MAKYLTTADIAEMCRTTVDTIRYWRSIGKGPSGFRVGRRVLFDERWLADLRASSNSGEVGR
jgi:DNA-binding transcriptional MerR regulator